LTNSRAGWGWYRGRNYLLGAQLDTFLVCAATGVVVNRLFLIITGYPQIGSREPGAIHISHSIYGGFAMMIAAAVALSFLHPNVRWFVAIVGGLGFGWYIDELGKYVSNAGYLYRPALAIIYVTFVLLFIAVRSIAGRGFGHDDAVANALESLKAAALGTLDDSQRRLAIARLDQSGPHTPFATRVRALLDDAPASPPRPPNAFKRAGARLEAGYIKWSHRRSFTIVIDVFFFVHAASSLGAVFGLTLDGPGITRPSERVAAIAGTIAGIMALIGIVRLRRSRLAAYRWFDRSMLVWILIVQVYMFQQEQFAAVVGLVVDLLIWVMLRTAIAIELRTEAQATAPLAPSPDGAPSG
jgi:hypothetical protein